MDWDPEEGGVRYFCLVWSVSYILQHRECNKADPQGWLAETCYKQSGYPSREVPFQGGCFPLGRSRRGQVQREEDFLPCPESGGPDGATALVRHYWQL